VIPYRVHVPLRNDLLLTPRFLLGYTGAYCRHERGIGDTDKTTEPRRTFSASGSVKPQGDWSVCSLNLANRITIARIFFIPVVVVLLLIHYNFWSITINYRTTTGSEILAALVFIAVASTDALDGYVARKQKLITNFGKFLDPLADKLLISAVLISLVEMQRLSAWVAIVIISREFAVTGLRLVAAAEGIILAASRIAKWKTGIQIVTMVALIINNFPFSVIAFPFDTLMVYITVIITVYSGIDYFVKNKQVINMEM
jgi:CDP-diacylglycerol--glycerol-3-phosphate 3-phosphatidyltransferase